MPQRVREELDNHVVLWGINVSLAGFAVGLMVLGDAMASLAVGMFVAVVYTYVWRGEGPQHRWCVPFVSVARHGDLGAPRAPHAAGARRPGRGPAEDLDAA